MPRYRLKCDSNSFNPRSVSVNILYAHNRQNSLFRLWADQMNGFFTRGILFASYPPWNRRIVGLPRTQSTHCLSSFYCIVLIYSFGQQALIQLGNFCFEAVFYFIADRSDKESTNILIFQNHIIYSSQNCFKKG